jgi:hypothetical protein
LLVCAGLGPLKADGPNGCCSCPLLCCTADTVYVDYLLLQMATSRAAKVYCSSKEIPRVMMTVVSIEAM